MKFQGDGLNVILTNHSFQFTRLYYLTLAETKRKHVPLSLVVHKHCPQWWTLKYEVRFIERVRRNLIKQFYKKTLKQADLSAKKTLGWQIWQLTRATVMICQIKRWCTSILKISDRLYHMLHTKMCWALSAWNLDTTLLPDLSNKVLYSAIYMQLMIRNLQDISALYLTDLVEVLYPGSTQTVLNTRQRS